MKLHLKNLTSIFRSTFGVERVWLQVAAGGEQVLGHGGPRHLRLTQEEEGVSKMTAAARLHFYTSLP